MTELEALEALLAIARSVEGALLFLVACAAVVVTVVVAILFRGKG